VHYSSFDVRLGMSAQRPVSARRSDFHSRVLALCLPEIGPVERLGQQFTTPMSFETILYRPESIRNQIERDVQGHGFPDVVLLDYSANPPERIREQVLMNSIAAIVSLIDGSVSRRFIVLLPKIIELSDNVLPQSALQSA
jgi:hypothetical protein